MQVRNEELRTTRELAREVASCLEALKNGDVEKLVITQNGKFVGVMISPERYEQLDPEPVPCVRCGMPYSRGPGGYAHGPGFCIDRRESLTGLGDKA